MGRYRKERQDWIISNAEFDQMINTIKTQQAKTIITILHYTGARISEVLKLKINDIFVETDINKERYLVLNIPILKQKKDKISKRTIRLPLTINHIDIILDYIKDREHRIKTGHRETSYLFDASYHHVRYRLYQMRDKLDIPISFHYFRRSHLSLLASMNISPLGIAQISGHSKLENVMIYIQKGVGTKEIAKKLSEINR